MCHLFVSPTFFIPTPFNPPGPPNSSRQLLLFLATYKKGGVGGRPALLVSLFRSIRSHVRTKNPPSYVNERNREYHPPRYFHFVLSSRS